MRVAAASMPAAAAAASCTSSSPFCSSTTSKDATLDQNALTAASVLAPDSASLPLEDAKEASISSLSSLPAASARTESPFPSPSATGSTSAADRKMMSRPTAVYLASAAKRRGGDVDMQADTSVGSSGSRLPSASRSHFPPFSSKSGKADSVAHQRRRSSGSTTIAASASPPSLPPKDRSASAAVQRRADDNDDDEESGQMTDSAASASASASASESVSASASASSATDRGDSTIGAQDADGEEEEDEVNTAATSPVQELSSEDLLVGAKGDAGPTSAKSSGMARSGSAGAESVLSWASAQDPSQLLPPEEPPGSFDYASPAATASPPSSSATSPTSPTAASASRTTPTPSLVAPSSTSLTGRRASTDRLSLMTSTTVTATAASSYAVASSAHAKAFGAGSAGKRHSITSSAGSGGGGGGGGERPLGRRDIVAHTYAPPTPLKYTPTRAEQEQELSSAVGNLPIFRSERTAASASTSSHGGGGGSYRLGFAQVHGASDDGHAAASECSSQSHGGVFGGGSGGASSSSQTHSSSGNGSGSRKASLKQAFTARRNSILRSFGHHLAPPSRDYQAEAATVGSMPAPSVDIPAAERAPIAARFSYDILDVSTSSLTSADGKEGSNSGASATRKSSSASSSSQAGNSSSQGRGFERSSPGTSPADCTSHVDLVLAPKQAPSAALNASPSRSSSSARERLQRTTRPTYSNTSFIPIRPSPVRPGAAASTRTAAGPADPPPPADRASSRPPSRLNVDKDLPPRPKSALSGLFTRKMSTTPFAPLSAASTPVSPVALRGAALPRKGKADAERTSERAVPPSRPGSALGGRLKSLAAVRSNSHVRSFSMTPIAREKEKEAPARPSLSITTSPATRSRSDSVGNAGSSSDAVPSRRLSRNLSFLASRLDAVAGRKGSNDRESDASDNASPLVSSPSSPLLFMRGARTPRRSNTYVDLPNESAVADEDLSELGHGGVLSLSASRRSSMRGPSAGSTSPLRSSFGMSPIEQGGEHSFVRTSVQRMNRSRESTFIGSIDLSRRDLSAGNPPSFALTPAALSPTSGDSSFTRLVDSAFFGDAKLDLTPAVTPGLAHQRTAFSVEPAAPPTVKFVAPSNVRKTSQPTLNISDDMEFLKALEEVRLLHRERLARLAPSANSGSALEAERSRIASPNDGRSRANSIERAPAPVIKPQPAVAPGKLRRANSADAHLGGLFDTQIKSSLTQAALDRQTEVTTDALFEAPLTVGRASGKLQDGAFDNDDDWKKEVKALFVIRELVQTERSYARHLESLVQAVRRASNPQVANARKDKRNMNGESSVSPHLLSLRSLLPQLIALSRALTTKIEEDPTAAGVGAAFRIIAPQLEATFVGWSFTIADIMESLRISEAPKSKSKDRIGLVYLSTQEPVIARPLGQTPPPSSMRGHTKRSISYGSNLCALEESPTQPAFTSARDDAVAVKDRPRTTGSVRPASSLGFSSFRALGAVRKAGDSVTSPSVGFKSTHVKALSPLDIVIMPTQRIPRYLLLLRDLQTNTPPESLSNVRLRKALDIVHRVAELCDEASHNYS